MDPHFRPPFCPHFFKFILDETSRLTKLKLPYKFVNEYGSELSNSATLRLRSGLEWDVEITRCDSKVWFEKGWPNLSKFYSIKHTDFLVFEYQGNSKFGICIFDKTATEIDYTGTVEVGNSSSGPSVVSPRKKNSSKSTGKLEILMKDVDDDDDIDESDAGSEEDKDGDEHPSGTHQVTKIQKEMALRRAKDYNPDEPHFVIAITVHRYLYVPSAITKLYLSKRPTRIVLQTAFDEEPWRVGIHYQKSGSRLQDGWRGFLKRHNLLNGDACIFVLKDSKVFLFDVVIYRAT